VNLNVVARPNGNHLRFRFPDTDALFGTPTDGQTLAGPVTIAVTAAGAPLPCDLAKAPCASKSGLVACIDDLYAGDGSCQPNANPIFPRFMALPRPNDFQATCFDAAPPCNPVVQESRFTIDPGG
jgi:hypothetical protein